ncbi:hypothetical protein HPB47_001360 [Ixodes persulcatus]|uniref:Uncharacterized protein n=1 Tax=Ixodes persulcatus TaxID=34615 RepID=A0AC60PP81_IXOPE|nr:hypothetical protein HPB47_001360 [Ixodes persulcatus]
MLSNSRATCCSLPVLSDNPVTSWNQQHNMDDNENVASPDLARCQAIRPASRSSSTDDRHATPQTPQTARKAAKHAGVSPTRCQSLAHGDGAVE